MHEIKLREYLLQSFIDYENNVIFHGAHVFDCGDNSLMIEGNGHILLADNAIIKLLTEKKCNEDLAFKLMQRNFASLTNIENEESPSCSDEFDIKPAFFMIDLTKRCNMGCRYCVREGDHHAASITNSRIDDICDFIGSYCAETSTQEISVQPWGGEPLLELDKIFRIQDKLVKKGIKPHISIETNGLLLNDRTIEKLQERNIFVGVSIDGIELVHDKQRVLMDGSPTHKKVSENLKNLSAAFEGKVGIIATVTQNSISYIEEIFDYFAQDLHLKRIKVNFVHKSDFVNNEGLLLSEKEISDCTVRIIDKLVELNSSGWNIVEYNIYTKLMNLLARKKGDICITRGCNGGRKMITFDFNGDVFPCDVTDYPEEKMGSIYDGRSLMRIISDAQELNSYFCKKETDHCSKCPWRYFCRGGCTVHVKCSGAQPPCIDGIECAINRALYPRLIELILNSPEMINKLVGSSIL